MVTIVKKMLCLLLLVCTAAAPPGCLTINKPPDNQPRKEVSVGGEHGVVVDRSDSGTEVRIGGDRGLVVGHQNDK